MMATDEELDTWGLCWSEVHRERRYRDELLARIKELEEQLRSAKRGSVPVDDPEFA